MSRSAAAVADRRIGAAVRCAGLVHVYRESGVDVAALRGVDLEVAAGERVALLGPSGSGKSTLLTILAGLRRPSAGAVLVDDLDIATTGERERYRYRSGLGLMLQGAGSNLLGWGTPMDNVRYAAGRRGLGPAVEVLAAGGLDEHRGPVRRLEIADRQVVALATALAGQPRMLLVDEPTSQLDEDARDRLLDLMIEGATAAGTTVVVVTHDEDVAARMQRMVRMREGRVGSEGLRHDQYAIVGADGSVQLPEALLAGWPPGSAVEVSADGADVIRLTRRHRSGDTDD